MSAHNLAVALLLAAFLPGPGAGAASPAGEDPSEALVPAVARVAESDPVAAVRALVGEARAAADPRAMGRAETKLLPLLAARPQDAELLTLRAVIRQWDHDFAGAEADLGAVLALKPGDAQALVSRAFLRASTGNLGGAAEDCRAISPRAGALVRSACHARVLGLTGKAEEAQKLLSWALLSGPKPSAEMKIWALTILADISLRLGQADRAEAEAAEALALAPASEMQAVRLAAIRLAVGKAEAALAALDGHGSDEALLIRAKALAVLGRDAAGVAAELGARIEAARRDGAYRHRRIEGEWLVRFGGDPARGLALLAENWAAVKEPEDLRALAEGAALAGQPEAAANALAWAAAAGMQDAVREGTR